MYNMVSADGFFAGIDNNIDWHVADAEFDAFAIDFNTNVYNVDAVLFGKTTYKMFEEYWPNAITDPKSDQSTRDLASFIQGLEKHVFSKSLDEATWEKSVLHREINPDEIKRWWRHSHLG